MRDNRCPVCKKPAIIMACHGVITMMCTDTDCDWRPIALEPSSIVMTILDDAAARLMDESKFLQRMKERRKDAICPRCNGHLTFVAKKHGMHLECNNKSKFGPGKCGWMSVTPQQGPPWQLLSILAVECMADSLVEGIDCDDV